MFMIDYKINEKSVYMQKILNQKFSNKCFFTAYLNAYKNK